MGDLHGLCRREHLYVHQLGAEQTRPSGRPGVHAGKLTPFEGGSRVPSVLIGDVMDQPDSPRSGVTRRAFIKGVIASGAVASSAAYLFRAGGELFGQTSAPGSVERLITLTVNSQMRRVDVMKQETLAMSLRYKLGLTGTK